MVDWLSCTTPVEFDAFGFGCSGERESLLLERDSSSYSVNEERDSSDKANPNGQSWPCGLAVLTGACFMIRFISLGSIRLDLVRARAVLSLSF